MPWHCSPQPSSARDQPTDEGAKVISSAGRAAKQRAMPSDTHDGTLRAVAPPHPACSLAAPTSVPARAQNLRKPPGRALTLRAVRSRTESGPGSSCRPSLRRCTAHASHRLLAESKAGHQTSSVVAIQARLAHFSSTCMRALAPRSHPQAWLCSSPSGARPMPYLLQAPLARCCSTIWGGLPPIIVAVSRSRINLQRCQYGIKHGARWQSACVSK